MSSALIGLPAAMIASIAPSHDDTQAASTATASATQRFSSTPAVPTTARKTNSSSDEKPKMPLTWASTSIVAPLIAENSTTVTKWVTIATAAAARAESSRRRPSGCVMPPR